LVAGAVSKGDWNCEKVVIPPVMAAALTVPLAVEELKGTIIQTPLALLIPDCMRLLNDAPLVIPLNWLNSQEV